MAAGEGELHRHNAKPRAVCMNGEPVPEAVRKQETLKSKHVQIMCWGRGIYFDNSPQALTSLYCSLGVFLGLTATARRHCLRGVISAKGQAPLCPQPAKFSSD